jgi:mRNA-degrading endonuclease HigB of HigAB toxin-antitoxin module
MNRPAIAVVNERREFTFTDIANKAFRIHVNSLPRRALIARVQYQAGALAIRFFGTHAEYDRIDAETV